MPKGRIEPANLDDRDHKTIVNDTIARIKDHCPEWTDHNPSDLGITLIELFAYIAETIIYRLNKVPEKNYIAFLNLLNITRDPPQPARVELTFIGTPGATIPKGAQVSTKPSEQEEAIVFETDNELILPANGSDSVWATNALTIKEPEKLGESNEEPHQVYFLKNSPLYKDIESADPLHHLEVWVGSETWTRVDEFKEGHNKQYMCNPVTGEIIFGKDNLGGVPSRDAEIKAMRYRYVIGGVRGNVPAGTLILIKTPTDGIKSVTNPNPALDGSDWEPYDDTLLRAPQEIKSRNRAVTAEDYEHLAKEATTEVAKVRCLGPKKKEIKDDGTIIYVTKPFDRSPGNVNMIINPDVTSERQPQPSDALLKEVKDYLDNRRVLTSELMLQKPIYAEIGAETKAYVKEGASTSQLENVKKELKEKLVNFLHPISGGPDGEGWEIGEDIYIPQIFDTINEVQEISYVESLKIKKGGTLVSGIRTPISEYEIACAAADDKFKIEIEIEPEEI